MELIPILSLIILVATISTFILAVGAYIMYKIRERKGANQKAAQPAAIPAEMVTPAPMLTQTQGQTQQKVTQSQPVYATRTEMRPTYGEERYTRSTRYDTQRQPAYTSSGETSQRPGFEMRPTYVGSSPATSGTSYSESRYQRPEPTRQTQESNKKKFLRYTSEGYVEPKKEKVTKQTREESLRWR